VDRAVLMVNIQDEAEFASHMLNRDTWGNATVKDVVQGHFIFWQQYVSSPQGQTFCQFYRVDSRPTTMILDADTRAKIKQWDGFVEPDVLLDQVTSFVEALEHSQAAKKQRAAARVKAAAAGEQDGRVAHRGGAGGGGGGGGAQGAGGRTRPMTEEEELEAAIRASMGGGGGGGDDDDDDDDDDGASAVGAVAASSGGADAGGGHAASSASSAAEVGGGGGESRAEAEARLGAEPAAGTEGATQVGFRLPDGTQVRRRFMASRPVQVSQKG
jgi:hypothetical protein